MHIYPSTSPSPRLRCVDLVTIHKTFLFKEEETNKRLP